MLFAQIDSICIYFLGNGKGFDNFLEVKLISKSSTYGPARGAKTILSPLAFAEGLFYFKDKNILLMKF